jgi:acetyltransferase EpsM
MTEILIVGAGTQAKYILDIIKHYPDHKILNIVDVEDNPEISNKNLEGIEIISDLDAILSKTARSVKVILAHSDNKMKEMLAKKLEEWEFEFVSIIHPQTVISASAKIGKGVIINPNVTIMPYACIGDHVMIHSHVVIEHDNKIEDFVNIAPGVNLAGYVTLKRGATIFTGANIIPSVTIGAYSVVGAGSTVLDDLPENCVAFGSPAKITRRK